MILLPSHVVFDISYLFVAFFICHISNLPTVDPNLPMIQVLGYLKYLDSGISSPELQGTLQSGQLPSTAPSNTHYKTMTIDRLTAAANDFFCSYFFAAMAVIEELGC